MITTALLHAGRHRSEAFLNAVAQELTDLLFNARIVRYPEVGKPHTSSLCPNRVPDSEDIQIRKAALRLAASQSLAAFDH